MKQIRSRVRQRGTQLVELAVALPLLALLALIVTEGASFIRVHQIINNAAREGARLTVLPENAYNATNIPSIQAATVTYVCNNGVNFQGTGLPGCTNSNLGYLCNGGTVDVQQGVLIPTASGVNIQGARVRVACSYQLGWTFGFPNQVSLGAMAEFPNPQ